VKLLEAADEILIVRLIRLAHRLPMPIQDCLVARLRRVGLAQFFGKPSLAALMATRSIRRRRISIASDRGKCFAFYKIGKNGV
jgi:hypothetical protein